MWLTKRGHARPNGGEETFPCRTKTKELSDSSFNAFIMLPPPLQSETLGRARGGEGGVCQRGCVRSVSSHMGSSSHLPPYSSQPDPYPQSSPAQQAPLSHPRRKKRLPAGGGRGGELGETKAGGRSCGSWGAPQLRPFDPGPWPWRGQTAQTDSIVSAPRCLLLLSLLSATQTLGADGETEEEVGGGSE